VSAGGRSGALIARDVTWVVLITALGLSACVHRAGSAPRAEPVKATSSAPPSESGYRDVVAGDTLYSIAWEAGRDYRELASWNSISPPYTIKPGQRIRLHPPAAGAATPAAKSSVAEHTVRKGETLYSIATRYDLAVADIAAWNAMHAPYTLTPGQVLRLSVPERAARSDTKRDDKKPAVKTDAVPTTPRKNAAGETKPKALPSGSWTWPSDGTLLARFNNGSSRGIDIGGKLGQPIAAAAAGTVVYQGSGLRGYGQLIIVKHDTDFLSAYAHCDRIVVREGNVIKRGQKIAEMGSTGTDRVKLHFEIRRRGTPVDPLDLLPAK